MGGLVSQVGYAQKTRQLAVPYYDQKENQQEGHRACNITSLAMVLDYYGVTDPQTTGLRTPDLIYDQFGIVQQPQALQQVFNSIAEQHGAKVRNVLYTQGTIAQLRERAAAGKPSIVHGWFTEAGHIVVVTGFDGSHYTVHDPYGKWDGSKHQPSQQSYDPSRSGKAIRYPAAQFEHAINDNGTGDDLWLHTFEVMR
jgi:ABC-type bacteriocin/lantibiotic exporter with double-glycine peptidase domain